MGGADRFLVCLVILSYGFSSRTHVAPDFAAKAAKGAQVASSQTPFVGSQHLEEVPFSQSPFGESPRISSAFSDGLAMPMQSQGQSQWSDTSVVQCLRSTLQGRCLVAGNFGTEEVTEQKEEIQPQVGTQGQDCGSRIARALRETGIEAGAKNQTPTPWVPSTPARKVQALAPTTPNPTTAPEENSQMLEKLQHLKQVVTEKGVGDAAMMETIGALEEAAKNQPVQPLKLTHKDVTQLQKAENSLVTLREQVGKLDTQWQEWDKYIKEKYDEQLQLYRTKRDTLVEKFKEQKEKVSTLKDKMKKAAAEAESKAEAEQSLPAVEIKEFVAGEKVDLTGLGDTDDELMEEVRPPARREESRRRQPQELAYEGRTQHVRFSPELAVSIFDEDGAPDSATFSFKLWEGELENWDSKPWALYGGPYVEAAGSAFSSSTLDTDDTLRGVGMSSASDRRTQLDRNLFHQLRDVQGDGLLPAVLEGQLPREDLLQVRLCTFGCLHSYLGRRNRIAVRVDEAPLAAFLIDEIYDMWKDITPSRLRIQIVHPQPEDFTAIPTIYVVVDFGEQGVDVPVLIDRRSYNDYGSSRHLSVAYLPP